MSLGAFRPNILATLALVILGLTLAGCIKMRHLAADPWTQTQHHQIGQSAAVPAAVVTRAQWLLWKLGYDPGLFNGVESRRTVAAVRSYQKSNRLVVDGRVSAPLVKHLEASREIKTVAVLQHRLHALGFDPGGIDGKLGPRTRTAIEAYQHSAGLAVDGALSPRLLGTLAVEPVLRRHGATPQPTEVRTSADTPPNTDAVAAGAARSAAAAAGKAAPMASAVPVSPDGDAARNHAGEIAAKPAPGRSATDSSEAKQAEPVVASPEPARNGHVVAALRSTSGKAVTVMPETASGKAVTVMPETASGKAAAAMPETAPGEWSAVMPEAATNGDAETGGTPEAATNGQAPAGETPDVGPAAEPQVALVRLPSQNAALGPASSEPDRFAPLAPGDQVRLTVFGESKEERDLKVSTDGRLYLSDGVVVRAAGLHLPELEEVIMIKLVETYLLGLSIAVSRLDSRDDPPVDQPGP